MKNLEYRGYDSAGLAYIDNNKRLQVKKSVGGVDNLFKKDKFNNLLSNIVIGHTRWATHGKPNLINAHPHVSNNTKIAVVHNGIIENFESIKDRLIKLGFIFYSETDTEIIPNLIQSIMDQEGCNFFKAFKKSISFLKGQYSFLAIHEDHDYLLGVKNGLSLALGIKDNACFISSDISSFSNYTNSIIHLQDHNVVFLEFNKYTIFDNNIYTKKINPVITLIYSDNKQKKNKYSHYTIQEIKEQSNLIDNKIILDGLEFILDSNLKLISQMSFDYNKVFLIGSGSSYHACLVGQYLLDGTENVKSVLASEFPYLCTSVCDGDIVICISQSGETADVLNAIKCLYDHEKTCRLLAITNSKYSSLYNICEQRVLLNVGKEQSVLSTKTYTAQVLLLSMIANDNINETDLLQFRHILNRLTDDAYYKQIQKIAHKLRKHKDIYLIGRGIQYPTALEGALKLKEAAYIHAEAFAGGELKHGSLALISKKTPCIVFVSDDTKDDILCNAVEVKSRGGYIIGVSAEKHNIFDDWIEAPRTNYFDPIVQIIPIQILAYQLALLKKINPDKPRNLAKCVTVK